MKQYTQSIRKALENENWYGALMIALSMPDICAGIETPKEEYTKRYSRWFNNWMKCHYTVRRQKPLSPKLENESPMVYIERIRKERLSNFVFPQKEEIESFEEYNIKYNEAFVKSVDDEDYVFLNGYEAFKLRCSILHDGKSRTRGKEVTNFEFVIPKKDFMVHCNMIEKQTLQLQIDIFCNQMADAVDKWHESKKEDKEIIIRIESLLKIHSY